MKRFKHLLFTLLALTLIIRPVFAEGFMVHTGSAQAVAKVQMMDLMPHTEHCQMMMSHGQDHAAMDLSTDRHSTGHSLGCADAGVHQCDGNCLDNSCSFISVASAITTAENLQFLTVEQGQTHFFNQVPLLARPTPPEQRPPLV